MAHSFDSNGHHALVVPAHNVKTVKTFLEEHQILDKSRKITPYTPESIQDDPSVRDQRFNSGKWFIIPFLSRAPSTIPTNGSGAATIEAHFGDLTSALESRLTPDALSNISIVHISTPGSGQTPTTQPNNPLRAAFHSALSTLPAETLSALSLTTAQLVADLPGTYSIYPPLLLLPAHTFHRPSWTTFLSAHHHHQPLDTDPTTFQHLLAHVAQHLSVTHIALNAPIALHNAPAASDQPNDNNILRSPTALTPLLGSFGPRLLPAPHAIPDASDFAAAFWATARQNGVAQTWAPLHTMFSRGNVKEKARVLGLASVAEAVRVGGDEDVAEGGDGRGGKGRRPAGCTAVD
ncbi:tRNA wybutosine-synthesizing protein 2, partial [Lasiodiplodia hormozganensis]